MTTQPDKYGITSIGEYAAAVHAGNTIDAGPGAIRTPLVMANSSLLPDDPAAMN